MKNEFVLNKAEAFDIVDSEYILLRNPNIAVQDARSYAGVFIVNEWRESEEAMYIMANSKPC